MPGALALALALAAAGTRLELEGWAGGGYDSNVSHDPSSASAVGSPVLTASAAIGASRPVGPTWELHAGGVASGTEVLDVRDLSGARAELELSAAAFPSRRVVLTGGAWGGRGWYRDDARDAWLVGAAIGARARIVAGLVADARYERSSDAARDAVYSTTRDRVVLSAALRVHAAVRLRASYAWTWADEVFYPVTAAGTGPGAVSAAQRYAAAGDGGTRRTPSGPMTSSFPGPERQVVRASALTGTARAGIEVGLSDHVYVDVAGAHARVDADAFEYDALSASAVLGWRR